MFLSAALFNGFSEFLQVILWVIVPLLFIVVITTVIIHNRKRKKAKNKSREDIELDAAAYPENFCYKTIDGKFVYLDHTGLLKELRKKLHYSNAKFAALQQDFNTLAGKNQFFNTNNIVMESLENTDNTQLQDNAGAEVVNEAPNKDLLEKLLELEKSYKSLEAENVSLLEQIGMQAENGIGSVMAVPGVIKEENSIPSNQLAEQEYYKDLLEEKNKQIEFLQSQVDLRIKKYHESEQERIATKGQLQVINETLLKASGEAESLRSEMMVKQQDVDALLINVNETEMQLHESRQALNNKQSQIIYIENVLQELREQNQLLNAAVADNNERNQSLQEQLRTEEQKVSAMEQKLSANRQLLQRLYKEFSACINEEIESSPVIPLRHDYINNVNTNNEWEEAAVH